MYTIIITEHPAPGATTADASTLQLGPVERLKQTLDELDVKAVIRLINTEPRKARAPRKAKS